MKYYLTFTCRSFFDKLISLDEEFFVKVLLRAVLSMSMGTYYFIYYRWSLPFCEGCKCQIKNLFLPWEKNNKEMNIFILMEFIFDNSTTNCMK